MYRLRTIIFEIGIHERIITLQDIMRDKGDIFVTVCKKIVLSEWRWPQPDLPIVCRRYQQVLLTYAVFLGTRSCSHATALIHNVMTLLDRQGFSVASSKLCVHFKHYLFDLLLYKQWIWVKRSWIVSWAYSEAVVCRLLFEATMWSFS
jgi:hypothetical protein